MKAHCDIETRRIYGCSKGTFEWFHEKGHIIFNEKYSYLLLKQQDIFYMWMGAVTMTILFVFILPMLSMLFAFASVIVLFIHMGIGLFEEIWCNNYAKKKLYR